MSTALVGSTDIIIRDNFGHPLFTYRPTGTNPPPQKTPPSRVSAQASVLQRSAAPALRQPASTPATSSATSAAGTEIRDASGRLLFSFNPTSTNPWRAKASPTPTHEQAADPFARPAPQTPAAPAIHADVQNDFHQAGTSTGPSRKEFPSRSSHPWIKAMWILGALAVGGNVLYHRSAPAPQPEPPHITETYDQFKARPAPPPPAPSVSLPMGGYAMHRNSSSWYLSQEQAKYIQDKAELEKAISACAANSPNCDPRVKAFAEMIEQVGHIPDRLEQVELVNAWVNMIHYDEAEAYNTKSNMDHHSLIESLSKNLLVCDEAARLKLFALEKLGFNENDIRWVGVDYYKDGTRQNVGHAVTEVRLNDKIWVMNIANSVSGGNVRWYTAENMVINRSKLETDTAFLNFSKQSYWSSSSEYYVPSASFNLTECDDYYSSSPHTDFSNVPAAALNAPAESTMLSGDVQTMNTAMSIMGSAFTPLYTIDGEYPLDRIQEKITLGSYTNNPGLAYQAPRPSL